MPVLSLSIGSNIDAADNIRAAVKALGERFGPLRCSRVYESEAVGFAGDNFLNLVVTVDTDQSLTATVDFLKSLEDELGRDRSRPRFSARPIDIDILGFGSDDGFACGLILPRPEIVHNAFVLRPLAELLPEVVHEPSGLSYGALWQRYDQDAQKLWPIDFDWQDVLDP